jgi:nitrate reductase delta subunit
MKAETLQQLYLSFATLLNYPGPDVAKQANACVDLLELDSSEAADKVREFVKFAENTPSGRLEEIYTGTFDVSPACFIFAGFILFGESFNRGKFLVGLQEKYREHGFSPGIELADHLSVILKFTSTLDVSSPVSQDMLNDCLVPVLQEMTASFKSDTKNPNPYFQVLQATLMTLEQAQQMALADD